MRSVRLVSLLVLITFARSATAQQTTATAPQATALLQPSVAAVSGGRARNDVTIPGASENIVGSDSEVVNAVDLLKRARTIAGWTIDWSAVSFQYSATMNLTSPAQGAGSVLQIEGKSSGPTKLAVRTSTSDSVVSTILNGTEAQIVSSSGTALESADSLSEADALFPFLLHAMTEFDDGSFSAEYTGQVALPQGEAYLIVLTPNPKPGDFPEDGKSVRSPRDAHLALGPDIVTRSDGDA